LSLAANAPYSRLSFRVAAALPEALAALRSKNTNEGHCGMFFSDEHIPKSVDCSRLVYVTVRSATRLITGFAILLLPSSGYLCQKFVHTCGAITQTAKQMYSPLLKSQN
jgi:hypothetical protein